LIFDTNDFGLTIRAPPIASRRMFCRWNRAMRGAMPPQSFNPNFPAEHGSMASDECARCQHQRWVR
jgi:hypothetical protein